MTGISKNTVTKLLIDLGTVCSKFQDETLRNLPCKRLQVVEIWSFCYGKQRNVPEDRKDELGVGDVWTWTAICSDSKLVPSWLVGTRDSESVASFMDDLASRLTNRVQLTSDGHRYIMEAVEHDFDGNITSDSDRQTPTLRMKTSWFTGLTNAFSKKIENHARALALHFMHYNFSRLQPTLKCTPAMRAGVTDRLWNVSDIVGLLEKAESQPD